MHAIKVKKKGYYKYSKKKHYIREIFVKIIVL